MTTTINQLRQRLYQQKNKVGLVGGTVTVNEYDEQDNNLTAQINPDGWKIEVNVKKGWNPITDSRQKAYARKKNIQDGLETVVMHLGGLHEPAHWELPHGSERGCPFDKYHHDKILEAVEDALPDKQKGLASYVANIFEDTIINPRCREFNGDYSGQVLFWDWEGIKLAEQGKKGFTPVYEAFVKLNMHLWGDNVDRALVKRHYQDTKKVKTAVDDIVKDLNLPENIKDTSVLFNKTRWPEMAHKFTKHLVPLLDEKPTERPSAYSQEGEGSEPPGQGKKERSSPGNGIEQKMETREGKEQVSVGRYASADKHSPNFTSFEQLDALYNSLSRAIPVKVEAMTREQGLRIGDISQRPYDEEVDSPAHIKPSKLMMGNEKLTFGVPRHPLTITTRSKVQRRGFPDFKLIKIDNSGSMKYNVDNQHDGAGNPINVGSTSFIPWGDNSKYHYALLGLYGVENFLRQQGIAQYIKHGLAMFSSTTRYAEADYDGLDTVRKMALSPDWGNTNIDASSLKKALQGRESFVLSLSDGDIANWSTERDRVRDLLGNNYFAHIQMGGKTQFTRDLESWGKPVFYVRSGEDLAKLMVEATMNTYRGFIRQ